MAAVRLILCFFLICMISEMTSGNYCDICIQHTLCKPHYLGPACRYYSYGLTPDQRNKVVNLHNYLRHKVASGNEKRGNPGPQPPAKYMPNLSWDDELAHIAQVGANSCQFKHDECINVARFIVGQNIAFRSADPVASEVTKALLTMVQSWYDEVELFNPIYVRHHVKNDAVGHYTNIVWANTTKIGCGFVHMTLNQRINFVCNYGAAGNTYTLPVYEIADNTNSRNYVK